MKYFITHKSNLQGKPCDSLEEARRVMEEYKHIDLVKECHIEDENKKTYY